MSRMVNVNMVNGESLLTTAVQSHSDQVPANIDSKFREHIDKAGQLTDILIADVKAELKKLEKQLDDERKLCNESYLRNIKLSVKSAHLETENLRLAKENDQIVTLKKANESLLKQNEDAKNDLRQCELKVQNLNDELSLRDIRIDHLVKDNDKLLKAKNAFNDRLKMFIQDISTTQADDVSMDLDATMETETLPEPETSNKRANDTPIPLSIVKRQRLASIESLSEPKNEEFVMKSLSLSVGDPLAEPLQRGLTYLDNLITGDPLAEPLKGGLTCLDNLLTGAGFNPNSDPGHNENAVFLVPVDSNSEIFKKPLPFSRASCRRNIKQVMGFESLTPASQMAYQKEKERKKQYVKNLKSYTETYGMLPGSLNKLNKLVLDFDPVTKCEFLTVDARLSAKLKPHQCEGVKFMWDACFESIDNLRSSDGSGCILAHCMGLGKTLQVVTLVHIHTLMTNIAKTKVFNVLIICPVNVIVNWVEEFGMWQKNFTKDERVTIYELASCSRTERKKRVNKWSKNGGVLVIGYRMFQDMVENELNAIKPDIIHSALISPGADLVVCDEGHLLKNPSSKLSVAVNKIRTLRRIVLTGTPLQNNLKEYYSMVEFVKPRLLGTEKEFNNRFVGPISNGQFVDSTDEDITLMKQRALILHKYLEGCVHRRDYSVLAKHLPPKQEYVLFIRLTKKQIELYKYCMKNVVNESPVSDLQVLKRICNHPKVLTDFAKRPTGTRQKVSETEDSGSDERAQDTEWWKSIYKDDKFELSGKMMILFSILLGCKERNEKLLVFSGSLSTLNVIEQFLSARPPVSSTGPWTRELDYFRFDGSDSVERRRRAIGKFNDETNQRARLFLISTKAGGLGINLMAANRVIIFDASWNPSDDIQSIFRAYRIGQTKECFIYRFVALGTMEEKIYDRQISKLSISKRVIDEHQIGRHYKEADLQQLYCVDGLDPPVNHPFILTGDQLLNSILLEYPDVVYKYHDHDSLLENVEADQLSDKEIGDVWDEFEAIQWAEELD